MRLWHKDLIRGLPRQQLIAQLRECVLIAKNIHQIGKPNHILVNNIMYYPIEHFCNYTRLVIEEMDKRNYNIRHETIDRLEMDINYDKHNNSLLDRDIFKGWHDVIYMKICYYNLFEKYLCGGITQYDWSEVCHYVDKYLRNNGAIL